jgi:hypothetical protein
MLFELASEAIKTPYENDLENFVVCTAYTYGPMLDFYNRHSIAALAGCLFGWMLSAAF